jgi:hypothetical protein
MGAVLVARVFAVIRFIEYGRRLNSTGALEFAPDAGLWLFKQRFIESKAQDFYTHWVRWFLADRSTRTISPFSSITVPEYVQRRVEENTVESLQESVQRLLSTSRIPRNHDIEKK